MKKFFTILLGLFYIIVGYSQTEFLVTESGSFYQTASGNFYIPSEEEYDESNWYFADDGDDSKHGHSQDSAKKTIAELNSLTLSPADSVFFKCSDTWREVLTIPNSGASGNEIVFTNYGTGDSPKILGSEKALDFTAHPSIGSIWGSSTDLDDPYSGENAEIWFMKDGDVAWGDLRKTYTTNFSNLVNEYDWTWNNDSIYVYAATDPDTRYDSIEVPQVNDIIALNSKDYLVFDGIDLFFSKRSGMLNTSYDGLRTGFTLRNSEIAYLSTPDGAGYGVHHCYSYTLIEYNTIHDCGRRGISYYNYSTNNVTNFLAQYNTFYNGFHTTGTDISTGAVAGATGDMDSVIIRNCLFYEPENGTDWDAAHISLIAETSSTGVMSDVYAYNNIFKFTSGTGFYVLDEIVNLSIYNNTFYGFDKTSIENSYHVRYTLNGGTSTTLKNNIFYNDADYDVNTGAVSVFISLTLGMDYSDVDADYNLYWTTDSRENITTKYTGGPSYTVATFSTLQGTEGWETNSPIPADPLFKDGPDSVKVFSNSGAVGAGIAIPEYTTDYDGVTVSSPPNIGAYENTEPYDATNYYFANAPEGDDANDGHSTYYPKETISAVNGLSLTPGDTVFFKKGDIFRGQIDNPEDGSGTTPVVFTSYGTGNKPVITTALNESSTGDWFEYSTNLWSNEDANFTGANYNVGNLIFNDDSVGYNRKTEAAVDDTIGEFWYDTAGDSLIVYCTSNPATYYGDIEVAINSEIFKGDASDNITIDGLAFKWTGRHGAVWNTSTADTLEIRNCDFMFIGGSENYDGAGFQLGNGIELYSGNYMDIVVEGNKFYQIFDAAFTPQYPDAGEDLNRIYIHGNLFLEVRYASELAWGTNGTIDTYHFNNNTCYRTSNYVFKRDNRWSTATEQMAFVTFYNEQNAANTDVDIYNNIFYYEDLTGIASAGVRLNFFPWPAHIDVDYNQYYSPNAFSSDHCLGNYSGTEYYTLGTWQSGASQDPNSYNSNPTFKAAPTNFRVHSDSDANGGGVAVTEYTEDYESVAVGSPPNIGAIETTED